MSEAQIEVKTVDVEVPVEVKNIIEALIFASDEPMTVRFIRSIVDEVNKDLPPSGHLIVNAEIIRKAVSDLNRGYGRLGSGFRITEVAGGFVYATQEQFASWVGRLAKERARRRLSPTAVETLAIIAYKQPITKSEVEFIRGVNVDYIINALLEKDLIQITGRQNSPGRPLLYGTTQKFLEHFGLNELTDLPKPREIAELISETELEVDRRLLAEQQEMEFQEGLEKKLEGHEGAAKKERPPKHPRSGLRRSHAEDAREKKAESEKQPPTEQPTNGIVGDPETPHPSPEISAAADIVKKETNETPASDTTPTTVFDEQGAQPLTDRTNIVRNDRQDRPENDQIPQQDPEIVDNAESSDRGEEHQSGWSKWKNKVRTFIKKLFG
jgi:segregation and condensation protein B